MSSIKKSKVFSTWEEVLSSRTPIQITDDYLKRWKELHNIFFSFILKYVPAQSKILEIGCGFVRTAIVLSNLGYNVTCIDNDHEVMEIGIKNANRLCRGNIEFKYLDMFDILKCLNKDSFHTCTHGGVLEHVKKISDIRKALKIQLEVARYIIFDVPLDNPENRRVFSMDNIFRHLWSAEYWLKSIFKSFNVLEYKIDMCNFNNEHVPSSLVCVIER